MTTKTLDEHIVITPGTCEGRPRIAGHRITVKNIVIWHEWMGWSVDEIAAEYDLTQADVHAALAYYYDHKAEMDEQMIKDEEFIEAVRRKTPSKVLEKLRGKRD